MRDLEDGQSEEYQHAHKKSQDQLPLHPQADLVLRSAPQAKYVSLVFPRRNDAQKIIDTRLDDGEVERKNDDQNEREDAAKDLGRRTESIIESAEIERIAHATDDVV